MANYGEYDILIWKYHNIHEKCVTSTYHVYTLYIECTYFIIYYLLIFFLLFPVLVSI